MDLSLRRAQAVADYLTTQGVAPDILRVQGCSTFEPVVQRAYAEDERTLNRRVEVEVTDTLVEERQDTCAARRHRSPRRRRCLPTHPHRAERRARASNTESCCASNWSATPCRYAFSGRRTADSAEHCVTSCPASDSVSKLPRTPALRAHRFVPLVANSISPAFSAICV